MRPSRPRAMMVSGVLASVALTGCARFVWHEDPFTPDQAPVSEVVVSDGDTTYVVRAASYYLLARNRAALWNRQVLDDAAWRYRQLFGESPPLIAVRLEYGDSDSVRLDSVRLGLGARSGNSGATWRGVPLVVVDVRRTAPGRAGRRGSSRDLEPDAPLDSAALSRLTSNVLAARAADAWLRVRAREVVRAGEGQPGGPVPAPGADPARYPVWFEVGAVATLGSDGVGLRSLVRVRADQRNVVPLARLFAVTLPETAPAAVLAGILGLEPGYGRGIGAPGARAGTRVTSWSGRAGPPAGEPLFLAQSVAVLSYLREMDPSFVARLADALARGLTVTDALGASATLPHDVAALDAGWRAWLRRTARRR